MGIFWHTTISVFKNQDFLARIIRRNRVFKNALFLEGQKKTAPGRAAN